MHPPGQFLNVFEWCVRQDAVAEIENVARASGSATQHVVGGSEEAIRGSEERGRIEISLDGSVVSNRCPCFIERQPPVDADHIATGVREVGENGGRADAEMDDRYAKFLHRRKNARRVRLCELAVI